MIIKIENLQYKVGKFTLGPLTIHIEKETFMVLVGPSGAGKSVFLELIVGLRHPQKGCIFIGDREVTRIPPEERNIGMVFQKSLLFPHISVFDNIAFGLRLRKVSESEIRKKVEEVARLCGVIHLLNRNPVGLSGGESQRVALARALAVDPQVLLLDEPLSALDRPAREELRRHLRRIKNELNLTVIHVTHDLEEAVHLADEIGIIIDGKIVQKGKPSQILHEPVNQKVAKLAGFDNVIVGKVISEGKKKYFVADGFKIPVPESIPRGEGTLIFRSRDAAITWNPHEPSGITFSGTLEEIWGWSEYQKATVRCGSTFITVNAENLRDNFYLKPPAHVRVKVNPEKIKFILFD